MGRWIYMRIERGEIMHYVRKPYAMFGHVFALICVLAAMVCLLLGPPPAHSFFQDVSCTGTRNGRYTVQDADNLIVGAIPEITRCAQGNPQSCKRARRMLWDADIAIEQILREKSNGECKECWLNELLGTANRLARWARLLRSASAAAGNQITINADQTAGSVQGHVDLPGCCPPGTWWNKKNGNCQPSGTGPPAGTSKVCHVFSSYGHNQGGAMCNVWRRMTHKGLNYNIIINPMKPYDPPQGYLLRYSAPCAQATEREETECERWKHP
jgi:hypothetical protein